jgi:hypothetical protein
MLYVLLSLGDANKWVCGENRRTGGEDVKYSAMHPMTTIGMFVCSACAGLSAWLDWWGWCVFLSLLVFDLAVEQIVEAIKEKP